MQGVERSNPQCMQDPWQRENVHFPFWKDMGVRCAVAHGWHLSEAWKWKRDELVWQGDSQEKCVSFRAVGKCPGGKGWIVSLGSTVWNRQNSVKTQAASCRYTILKEQKRAIRSVCPPMRRVGPVFAVFLVSERTVKCVRFCLCAESGGGRVGSGGRRAGVDGSRWIRWARTGFVVANRRLVCVWSRLYMAD